VPRKSDLVAEIAGLIGIDPPAMSTGSTEPKVIFVEVNTQLGLGLPSRLTKPGLARAIVEASGGHWDPTCESNGSTVTIVGLKKVRDAVAFFVA
jgi:hypothetical protein